MKTQLQDAIDADEIIVSNGNGGNGNGGTLTRVEAGKKNIRVAYAKGLKRAPAELVERYESMLDERAARLKERIKANVEKALELATKKYRTAEPVHDFNPSYKWWDVFVEGPIQDLNLPAFRPHKIIRSNETALFNVYVVKNPNPMYGGPSALTVLCGRPFRLRAITCNLSTCGCGPSVSVDSAFDFDTVQSFGLVLQFPAAPQGEPDLYEVNVTLDVTDAFQQPDAGFATRLSDIDDDPSMNTQFTFPNTQILADIAQPPHVHEELPMRFLVYTA